MEGFLLGIVVGSIVIDEGRVVGDEVGDTVGLLEGRRVDGFDDTVTVGKTEEIPTDAPEGNKEGTAKGIFDGGTESCIVGSSDGEGDTLATGVSEVSTEGFDESSTEGKFDFMCDGENEDASDVLSMGVSEEGNAGDVGNGENWGEGI